MLSPKPCLPQGQPSLGISFVYWSSLPRKGADAWLLQSQCPSFFSLLTPARLASMLFREHNWAAASGPLYLVFSLSRMIFSSTHMIHSLTSFRVVPKYHAFPDREHPKQLCAILHSFLLPLLTLLYFPLQRSSLPDGVLHIWLFLSAPWGLRAAVSSYSFLYTQCYTWQRFYKSLWNKWVSGWINTIQMNK